MAVTGVEPLMGPTFSIDAVMGILHDDKDKDGQRMLSCHLFIGDFSDGD